jgi:uncharacterized protein YbcI
MNKVADQVTFRGAKYIRIAQLQQLLQQFETEAGGKLPAVAALQKSLAEAHKALLNKDDKEKKQAQAQLAKIKGAIPELVKQFEKDLGDKINSLVDLTSTIAGHVGMGGQ